MYNDMPIPSSRPAASASRCATRKPAYPTRSAAWSSVSSGETSTSGMPLGIVYGSSARWSTLRRRSSSASRPMVRARQVHRLLRANVSACQGPRYGARGQVLVNIDCRAPGVPRDPVRPGEHHRGHHARAPRQRIRTTVVELLEGRGQDRSVGVGRQADAAALVPGRRRGHEVLAPVLDPFHRPAEVVAGEDDDLLVAGQVRLLPEPAADVAHRHPDVALGDSGDPGGDGADVVR